MIRCTCSATWELGESAHHSSCSKLHSVQWRVHLTRLTTSATTLSVDGLLELLHGEDLHCLRRRLGLEDAWLLGEGIDALPCRRGWLLLQLHVQHSCQLEGSCLFQFLCRNAHDRFHGAFYVLCLQTSGLCCRLVRRTCSHRRALLR